MTIKMKIKLLNMIIDKRKHLRTTPIIVGGIFGDNLPFSHKDFSSTAVDKEPL